MDHDDVNDEDMLEKETGDDNPCLYILMRNDLVSMNSGKAVAQGAHAANQFISEIDGYIRSRDGSIAKSKRRLCNLLLQWKESANGFGTTIVLSVNYRELCSSIDFAINKGLGLNVDRTNVHLHLFSSLVFDPTYPYVVDEEYAEIISHPNDYKPKSIGNGKMLCIRPLITAGFIFGNKSDAEEIVKDFSLMP